jgi:hypothetical protein
MKSIAYAWLIKADKDPYGAWVLCRWAMPSPGALEQHGPPPSPEARLVRVELVPTKKGTRRLLHPMDRNRKEVLAYKAHKARQSREGGGT